MIRKQLKSLVIIVGIFIGIAIFFPEVFMLVVFAFCLSILVFCIIELYKDASITAKGFAYLNGFILSAIGTARMIKYFADRYPEVGMAVVITLGIISVIFLTTLGVILIKWLYGPVGGIRRE